MSRPGRRETFVNLRRLPHVLPLVKVCAPLVIFLALALFAGCSSVSARKVIALDRFQHIYVEQRFNDNHRLDELIVAELKRHGRDASSGPPTMMPENTQAIMTYEARWEWDFKTYLIELNLELHATHPRKKVADGRYYQPSIKTKGAADAIREILTLLFAK